MTEPTLEQPAQTSAKPPVENMRFMDVFTEDKNEVLTLQIKLRVSGQDIEKGSAYKKGEKIAGVDFHILRYLDIAVVPIEEGFYEVKGFFPQK